jgi:serine/threonine protein kinase
MSYRPPELFFLDHYDNTVDMWSFGCIVYETITGQLLFPGFHWTDVVTKMANTIGPFPQNIIEKSTFKLKCNAKAVNDKSAITKHKTVVKYGDVFSKILDKTITYEPSDRISAKQVFEMLKSY